MACIKNKYLLFIIHKVVSVLLLHPFSSQLGPILLRVKGQLHILTQCQIKVKSCYSYGQSRETTKMKETWCSFRSIILEQVNGPFCSYSFNQKKWHVSLRDRMTILCHHNHQSKSLRTFLALNEHRISSSYYCTIRITLLGRYSLCSSVLYHLEAPILNFFFK